MTGCGKHTAMLVDCVTTALGVLITTVIAAMLSVLLLCRDSLGSATVHGRAPPSKTASAFVRVAIFVQCRALCSPMLFFFELGGSDSTVVTIRA